MSNRKSTTARTVYRSPEGRVVVTRTEDADYNLSIDNQPAGVYTTAHAAEVAGLVELEYRVRQERWLAADEAAYAAMRDMMRRADNASLDALEQSENEHADTFGAPEPDEPTPPDDDDLAAEGLRIASPDEAGWTWRNLWVTDASPDDDEAAELAARNFTDERDEADEAYQRAYRSAAQAMDAALDLTCYCELCGGAVMPDEAALVGEQMACGWCAGEAQGKATTPAPPRLLWSWAGNAAALGAVVSERRAAWFARQERMRVTAGTLGLLSREAK